MSLFTLFILLTLLLIPGTLPLLLIYIGIRLLLAVILESWDDRTEI